MTYELTLERLYCGETEDWGNDEALLDVDVDGRQTPYLRRSMDDGDTWRLNRQYTFEDAVRVTLWDEDDPDSDDFLGRAHIDATETSGETVSFRGDGANYRLRYSVRELDAASTPESAIDAFRASSTQGVWRYVSKRELIADMELKLQDAYRVRQRKTPLCGPASIAFELIRKQPDRYVQVCRSLFENGSFEGRTETVTVDRELRDGRPDSSMSPADWLLLASMRDTENAFFDFEGDDSTAWQNLAGITTPGEMEGWAREVLGYETTDFESTYVYGEFDALRAADRAVRDGGVAFLMINSAILDGERPTFDFPNHWVTYTGGLDIDEGTPISWWSWYDRDDGHVSFDCYSWGPNGVDIGEGAFEDGMWGVVTAR